MRCDTLLAIVTNNTKESWWVPFEIGTAREMPRVIVSCTSLPDRASYQRDALPEYLLEWPRLRTENDNHNNCYARYWSYPSSPTQLANYIEDAYQARTSRSHLIKNSQEMMKYNAKCKVCGVTH